MICKYRNVSERDMDLLFMEAFATDPEFAALFINRTDYAGQPFLITHAERSKVDNGLGESDLTVIYEVDGIRHALLIEDKIDAVAMPDQHGRYIKRGNKGVERGEYTTFDVFILCPLKYRESNEEAAKYENFVSYEECRDYFNSKIDPHSQLWFQQICQALETMKAEYKVDLNEVAIDSFQKYAAYQKEYFPRLRLMSHADTKKVNGWWPSYGVGFKGAYIIHNPSLSKQYKITQQEQKRQNSIENTAANTVAISPLYVCANDTTPSEALSLHKCRGDVATILAAFSSAHISLIFDNHSEFAEHTHNRTPHVKTMKSHSNPLTRTFVRYYNHNHQLAPYEG